MVVDMHELQDWIENLNETERFTIARVLEKDLAVQTELQTKSEAARLHVQQLRQQSALRASGRANSARRCARCKLKLGYLLNSGHICAKCRQRVCPGCMKTDRGGQLCVLCYSSRDYLAISGEWFGQGNASKEDPRELVPPFLSATILTEIQRANQKFRYMREREPLYTSPKKDKKGARRAFNIVRKLSPRNRSRDVAVKPRPRSELLTVSEDTEQFRNKADTVSLHSVEIEDNTVIRSPSVPIYVDYEDDDGTGSDQIQRPLSKTNLNLPFKGSKAVSTGDLSYAVSGGRKESQSQPQAVVSPENRLSASSSRFRNDSMSHSSPSDNSTRLSSRGDQSFDRDSNAETASIRSFRTVSMASISSVFTQSGIQVQGDILIGLEYNCRQGALEVHVSKGRNLAPADAKKQRSNTYVKTYLLPDTSSSSKRKTHVKRNTLDPVYKETLKYVGLTKSELERRTLLVGVWHSDFLGHNLFLGEARIPLCDYSWSNDSNQAFWYALGNKQEEPPPDPTQPSNYCGQVCLSYLYPDKKKQTKQKSHPAKNPGDPKWNHTFVYDQQTLQGLSEQSLELTLWDFHIAHSNVFLGGIRINLGSGRCLEKSVDWMDASAAEGLVWKTMLQHPNTWIDATLPLRATMGNRK